MWWTTFLFPGLSSTAETHFVSSSFGSRTKQRYSSGPVAGTSYSSAWRTRSGWPSAHSSDVVGQDPLVAEEPAFERLPGRHGARLDDSLEVLRPAVRVLVRRERERRDLP